MTLAAKRMAGRNVLVKDLQGVETLGAITLLATDKTGTLTRNQMTVTYVWSGMTLFSAQPIPPVQDPNSPKAIELDLSLSAPNEVFHMASLCTRAKFTTTDVPIHERQILGDATESGLLRMAALKVADFEFSIPNFAS